MYGQRLLVTCLLQRQRAPLYPLESAGALRQLRTPNGTVLPYTIDKLIALLCLLLRMIAPNTPAIYRPNDRAYTPTINRPTDRQALYLTTITTAAGTVLPPE